jgi:chromosome segregation protein
MFLKRIILKNFKSFSGKTVLDFPCFFTAIVGPNGSGKSNIVDAIRWAFGEQSFKNLRAEKGRDLIFSGKNKGSSAGFSEVELIFDNSKKSFPLEVSELSILRRIDKEDNNSYFLNHQSCRLKDIIEMLAAARLGLKGLSIINQGSIGDILKVSPRERRMMLEENFGLKNLGIKKEEAKRKLENTLINLDKAQSLQQEILPHMRSLKRQVSRWEKREKIKDELFEIEKKYFINIYHQILKENTHSHLDLDKIKKDIEILEDSIREKEKEIGLSSEKTDRSLEIKIKDITQQIIALQNEKSIQLRSLGRKEVSSKLNITGESFDKKIFNIKEKLQSLLGYSGLEEIKKEIEDIIQGIDTLINSGNDDKEKEENLKEIQNGLDKIEEEIKKNNQQLNDWQDQLNKRSLGFRTKFQEIESKREEKEKLYRELQREEILNEKFRLRMEDFKRRLRETGFDFQGIEELYEKEKNMQLVSVEEFSILENRIWKSKKELSEMGSEDENIINEYAEVSNRYEFLDHQIEDLNKGVGDLNILIKELDNQVEQKFSEAIIEINKEFNRYFQLIFKGGSAKLIQDKQESNNHDIVWGVDIKINIPKTQLKGIDMLSGGEKTLITSCLLFALVNQSNSPLIVVDEIDAALDEENSRRFSEILKALTKNTQFIIITHNRMTMNAVQIIYGVTLAGNENSQLLSLKLEETEALAEE